MASLTDLVDRLGDVFNSAVSRISQPNQAPGIGRRESIVPQQISRLRQLSEQYTPQISERIQTTIKNTPQAFFGFSPAVPAPLAKQAFSTGASFLAEQPSSYLRGADFILNKGRRDEVEKMDLMGKLQAAGDVSGFVPFGSIAKAAPKAVAGIDAAQAGLGQFGKIKLGPAVKAAEDTVNVIKAPKKISWLQQGFNRARNVIASQGEAGQEIANRLQGMRDMAETSAGQWVSKLPTIKKLSKSEFENFVDVAEGKARPLNAKIAQAAQEWGGVRNEIYQTAKASGLDIGKLENYFPHRFDPKMFEGDNFVKAVQHLVQTGQASTTDEAAKMLRYAQDTVRNRRQGNLEIERMVDLPGYEKTKDALLGYISSASERIAQVKNFGLNDEGAMELINRIGQEGGDASTVKELFDISVGAKKYGETQKAISNGLRKFNTVTKLGLGAITNTGQSVNTATVTGAFRTLLSAPKAAFSKEAKDFALKSGVTLDTVINDLREGAGFADKMGRIGAPGFGLVEKFNRTLAAVAGRDYARSLAQKGDTKTLAKMGITLKGNALTPEQEIQAARNIVERTQFKVDAQDLPGWTSSPWGKVLTQFKSFSYNQTAFIGREIIQPAMQGDVKPLIRFLAIGIPVGMGLQTGKNILRNRKDEENPYKRAQQGLSQVGGLGLAGDVVTGLFPQNSKYLDPNRATTMALGTLGGPTVGTAIEGYGALANAVQGKPENLMRFGLKMAPVIGGTLQNTFLPYKSATGEVNTRYGAPTVGTVSASSENNYPQGSLVSTSEMNGGIPPVQPSLTPVEQAGIKEQISQLNAKEKEILDKNGFFGLGGLSDEEKNTQLFQLEAQRTALQEQLKTPEQRLAKEKELTDVEYTYLAETLKRNGDYGNWATATQSYVSYLEDYKTKITDKADKIRVQNKIDELKVSLGKYGGYGGFKAPKKPKKVRINIKKSSGSPSKVTFRKTSVGKVPVLKFKKIPKIRIKTDYGSVEAVSVKPFRNTLTS